MLLETWTVPGPRLSMCSSRLIRRWRVNIMFLHMVCNSRLCLSESCSLTNVFLVFRPMPSLQRNGKNSMLAHPVLACLSTVLSLLQSVVPELLVATTCNMQLRPLVEAGSDVLIKALLAGNMEPT